MTRGELEKIKIIKSEIKILQKQITEVESRIVSDTVTGCTPKRLDKHVIRITGIDTRKSDELQKRMRKKLVELQELLFKLEEWIEGLEDPEMRAILRLKYRNGLKDWEIAEELGYERSTVSWKLKRFFNEN